MLRFLPFALLLLCSAPGLSQEPPAEQRLVERFLEAYNRHDVAAMLRLVHPQVEWLSVSGETISRETSGAAALAEATREYFASVPSARSTMEGMMPAGRFVSVWERAHWETSNGPRSQTSLSVYEVEDGAVRRIWYFPAQP
jgi:hypothetical protein